MMDRFGQINIGNFQFSRDRRRSHRRGARAIPATIVPAELGYGVVGVTDEFMKKHNPEIGGYYVVYEDGYKSYSPAAAFESGYTRI